jgi:hypothetical protein
VTKEAVSVDDGSEPDEDPAAGSENCNVSGN